MTDRSEIGTFINAVSFAAEKHRKQRRKDAEASPYINHPIELANVLANEANVTDIDTLCAAVLHDTLEDTETTAEELREVFGERIAAIVLDLTDDKSLPYDDRKESQIKHAPNCLPEAKLVKFADKICNLRNILSAPPVDWSDDRKERYFKWAGQVVQGIRGSHPELERIFDELVRERKSQYNKMNQL